MRTGRNGADDIPAKKTRGVCLHRRTDVMPAGKVPAHTRKEKEINKTMNQDKRPFHASEEPENSNGRKNRPDSRDLLRKRKNVSRPTGRPGGKPGWSLGHRMAFLFLLVLLGVFLWKQMNSKTANYAEVSYSHFDRLLNTQQLGKVMISNGTLKAKLKQKIKLNPQDAHLSDGITTQIGSYDQAFIKEIVAKGVEVSIEPERTWVNIIVSTLPWILVFGVWLFFLRQMQGGPKGVFTFGKSKAKLTTENTQKITFADVAGVSEAKEELEEIIDFLKDPRKFQRLGGKIPKGALLVGPPGTGKTLLARAVAGEAGVPFFSMSGSDFVEMFVGVGASRVRDLFDQGKTNAPCIIFIDEIDAVGRQRGAGIGGGHDEREQTLNQLLVEMDGFESNEGVILLAATNRPDVLDPALLRPGRFDRQIVVDWPDVKARADILKVHGLKIQLDPRVDMESIARGTPGMTGADLANVVNEAALLAARLNRKRVTMSDFEEAKDKVMMGAARKTLVITEDEKRLTAYHEAGHVLVSKFIVGADPVHKVSIVARGRALGLTHFLPQDERHNWSFNFCMGKLAVLLGGRAAEMVQFGDITNGSANDIERATSMARKMVCEWGMSKRLGPLTFGKKEQEIFLGREIATHKDYSEQTAIAIDQEVRKYVETAQQQAESIVQEHTDKLELLTSEILKKEVLSGDEIDAVLNGDLLGNNSLFAESGARKTAKPAVARKNARQPKPRRSTKTMPKQTSESSDEQFLKDAPKLAAVSDTGQKEEEAGTPAQGDTPSSRSSRRRRGSRTRSRKPLAQGEKSMDSNDAGIESDTAEKTKDAPKKAAPADSEKSIAPGSVEKKPGDRVEKAASNSSDNNNDDKKPKGGVSSDKKKSSVFRSRRTRMISLKTGGRRRVIQKAPAQKIREIN